MVVKNISMNLGNITFVQLVFRILFGFQINPSCPCINCTTINGGYRDANAILANQQYHNEYSAKARP